MSSPFKPGTPGFNSISRAFGAVISKRAGCAQPSQGGGATDNRALVREPTQAVSATALLSGGRPRHSTLLTIVAVEFAD